MVTLPSLQKFTVTERAGEELKGNPKGLDMLVPDRLIGLWLIEKCERSSQIKHVFSACCVWETGICHGGHFKAKVCP